MLFSFFDSYLGAMQFKFQQSVGGTKYMVQISEMLIVQAINLLHTGKFVIQGKEKKKK